MTLGALLDEIAQATVPLTRAELGRRLGVDAERIDSLLAALRAHGLLIPDRGTEPPDVCAGAGSCGRSCPGPAHCALVGDSGLVPLHLVGRRDRPTRQPT